VTAYYNENDPKAAAWLRELIKQGAIANGEVDERSIEDVTASDLRDFIQCHFFAGIGGWSYALRLAGWADNRPVWTGSCPCQPFSAAGQKAGTADKRHLWPHFFRLIREHRPATIFGEQVASKDGLAWLDIVSSDLESEDYAVGAIDLCAAGVEAPHQRQRLWFVANANGADAGAEREQHGRQLRQQPANGGSVRLGHTGGEGLEKRERDRGVQSKEVESQPREAAQRSGDAGELVLADGRGWPARNEAGEADRYGSAALSAGRWFECDWIECIDKKWRPIEPGSFPLAYGVSARMGRLRGYGNAIVPQVAAEFIRAYDSL
jgi:DNA (cytosine-5)-methyltransferase 1